MSPATTPEPKTWGRSKVSATELNREIRDQLRDLQSRVTALTGGGGGSLFPTGAVIAWTGGAVPSGWLLCDGRTVLIADYTALSTEIGIAYNTGGESPLEFRLPKLNEALPRMGDTSSGDGALNNRGPGAGANSVTSSAHPATLTYNSSVTGNSGANSVNHGHDNFAIHAGSGHSFVHNHNVNQNTGGHNHAVGHNHNLGVFGVGINRNTGNRIIAVGHNHSCIATNIDSSGDGAHNHAFTLNASNANVNATSTDTGGIGIQYSATGGINVNAHSHSYDHSHSWGTTHTFPQVPASVSVNYIIKA